MKKYLLLFTLASLVGLQGCNPKHRLPLGMKPQPPLLLQMLLQLQLQTLIWQPLINV